VHAQVSNGSFETGDLTDWIVQDLSTPLDPVTVRPAGSGGSFFTSAPTDGMFSLMHGFDGSGPGVIRIAQDIFVSSPTLEFDFRVGWDNSGTFDRLFIVNVEPAGGGPNIQSEVLLIAAAGTFNPDTGFIAGVVDLSSLLKKCLSRRQPPRGQRTAKRTRSQRTSTARP
jgi:hypothetical protein